MAAGHILYVVVSPEGTPRKRTAGTLMIYEQLGDAKRLCRVGDAVMRLSLDLSQEPVFIKGRKMPNIEDDDGDA